MRYDYLQGFNAEGRMLFDYGDDVADLVASNGDAVHYVWVHGDELEPAMNPTPKEAANRLFAWHNWDDRPRGKEIRSMCHGDVLVIWETDERKLEHGTILVCRSGMGWQRVAHADAGVALLHAAKRRAYTTVRTADLYATKEQEVVR